MKLNQSEYESLIVTDYNFRVPLDYGSQKGENISIFVRSVSRKENSKKSMPCLIFFQGGPGYESPRPLSDSGWIKTASEVYDVILIDQRGTGLSSPISAGSVLNMSDNELAKYLAFFRADNIIKDAELLRKKLIGNKKWSVLGQSFGGFCAMTYLSFYPESLEKVFILSLIHISEPTRPY